MCKPVGMAEQGMKRIVDTDNFGGDYPDEKFLLWPLTEDTAKRIAAALNAEVGPDSTRYYRVVDMDYKLQPGFEP